MGARSQETLPHMAFSIFQAFAEEVHSATFALTKPDSEVVRYVEKLEVLKGLKASEASLNERCREIDSLYALISARGIEVPDFEAAAVATLETDFDTLKNAIEEVRARFTAPPQPAQHVGDGMAAHGGKTRLTTSVHVGGGHAR